MGCTKVGVGVDLAHTWRLPPPCLCNDQLATHNFPGIDIDSLIENLIDAQQRINTGEGLVYRKLKEFRGQKLSKLIK